MRMKIPAICGCLVLLLPLKLMTDQRDSWEKIQFETKLSSSLLGWQRSSQVKTYNPDSLYKYINGGAELFISYNFKYAQTFEYRQKDATEIKVDIFHMGHPHNAFGVFWHGCEKMDRFINPKIESQYHSGLLTFWKGPFYVSIMSYPQSPQREKLVKILGQKIVAAIGESAPPPPLVNCLPSQNLVPNSIRYFYNYIWLNSHYFISHDNLLNLHQNTSAVLAKYRLYPGVTVNTILLIIHYPQPKEAQTALDNFQKAFFNSSKTSWIKTENHGWVGCIRMNNQLLILLRGPDLSHSRDLMEKIKFTGF